MNTWNVAAEDLEFLSRHLEDLEAAGTPSFGLILTDRVPYTFDSEKKTLWGEDIGTLICSETDDFDGLTGVFGAWIFGSAVILFATTTIQGIL